MYWGILYGNLISVTLYIKSFNYTQDIRYCFDWMFHLTNTYKSSSGLWCRDWNQNAFPCSKNNWNRLVTNYYNPTWKTVKKEASNLIGNTNTYSTKLQSFFESWIVCCFGFKKPFGSCARGVNGMTSFITTLMNTFNKTEVVFTPFEERSLFWDYWTIAFECKTIVL